MGGCVVTRVETHQALEARCVISPIRCDVCEEQARVYAVLDVAAYGAQGDARHADSDWPILVCGPCLYSAAIAVSETCA